MSYKTSRLKTLWRPAAPAPDIIGADAGAGAGLSENKDPGWW